MNVLADALDTIQHLCRKGCQAIYNFGDRKEFKERNVRGSSLAGLGNPLRAVCDSNN